MKGNVNVGKIVGVIAIVVIVIVLIGVIVYKGLNKDEGFVYATAEATTEYANSLIGDYNTFTRFISKSGIEEEVTINYKKYNIEEYYNEEFFTTKKVAVILVLENTSMNYIHSVDSVTYNSDKTEATIKYTYKTDGYAGTLKRQWYTCMLVEVDSTVTNVSFVLDNGDSEE